nr:HlyD family efflux transporter periplasmic adaptor subunit [uncultured Fluviicola sp.]
MEEKRNIDIELKSEQMNEMLSTPPKWIVRSGNGVFLIVLLIITGLAWFIRYPDEIVGEVLVTSSKPPIELSNQSYIQLKTINVAENQEVNAGDLIAQFDIQAKSEDIEKAKNYLDQLETFNGKFQEKIPVFSQQLKLGTFQEQWTTLLSKIEEWNSEYSENMIHQELASIKREISFREQLQIISNKKIKLSEGEYELIQEQLASSERLAEQNAISKQSLTQDKRTQSQALQSVQSQKEQHVQNLITLNTLRKESLRLEHDAKLKKLQMSSEIQISLSALINGFQTWEKNTVWIAPCSGKVMFNKLLQVNRFYKVNEASIVIVPKGSGYTAIATIASTGSGKVKVGQKTFIELTDFPRTEFGMLEGKVSTITKIDKEGKYEVKIQLPKQMKTTYNRDIPFKAQLKGSVKIVTKDKRLLARFFEQLTDLIK